MGKGNQGQGHVYLRGDIFWIKYHKDGRPFYESTGSWKKSEAITLLRKRLASPTIIKTGGVLVGELLDDLVLHYQHRNKGAEWGERIARYLRPFWGHRKADKVTTAAINEYVKLRKGDGLGPASINRELAILRKAMNLGKESTPRKVGDVPKFVMLKEAAPRKGFLDHDQYVRLLEALPEELRVPLIIGYHTGSRKGEVLGIRLDQVDLKDEKIRLYDTKKHVEGRWLPIYGEMIDAIAKQVAETKRDYPQCPWLSHRQGDRIVDLRPAWPDACEAVELDGLLFHDLRRSAIRNMENAGIPREVAKKISGHKTDSAYIRYAIVDNRDIENAGKKLAEYLKGAA